MKKVILVVLALILLPAMVACAGKPGEAMQAAPVSNAEPVEVTIVVPGALLQAFGGYPQEELVDLSHDEWVAACAQHFVNSHAGRDGVISVAAQEDGSVALVVTAAYQQWLMDAMREQIEFHIAQYTDEGSPAQITGVTFSDDYTECQMKMNSGSYEEYGSQLMHIFAGDLCFYQIYCGAGEASVSIAVLDTENGGLLGKFDFPEV